MCCFSGSVQSVSQTRIYARGAGTNQHLAYQMQYATASPVAMILPLPVPPGSPEADVRFISLDAYPEFFDDLERAFRPPPSRALESDTMSAAPQSLVVHDVGQFVASFVPRVEDFDRLDPRFRLPKHVWDALPIYRDYGFAVFQLKPVEIGAVGQVHPMAFTFPRRDPEALFFPTVHIRDVTVSKRADFDHALFCQADEFTRSHLTGWQPSQNSIRHYVGSRVQEFFEPDELAWQLKLRGPFENKDTILGPTGQRPEALEIGLNWPNLLTVRARLPGSNVPLGDQTFRFDCPKCGAINSARMDRTLTTCRTCREPIRVELETGKESRPWWRVW